jgi:large subunit ribosomal protein L25
VDHHRDRRGRAGATAKETNVTQIAISGERRDDFGKGAARRLRRTGRVPAVLYGTGHDLLHVSLPGHELDLALRRPRVVLKVTVGTDVSLVKPRDVQRDPVKRTLEHVDLVIISEREAALRSEMADAIAATEAAAVEAGVDPAAAIAMLETAVADGETPLQAASHAVQDAEEQAKAYAAAAAAAAAAATAAEAQIAGEAAEAASEQAAAPAEE